MGKTELESWLNTIDIWLIVFGVLVAIGVVGESIFGFLHWRRSGELHAIQTTENLSLERDIENLRASNLELQKQVRGREISGEQRRKVIAALTGNVSVDMVVSVVPDPEARMYAVSIVSLLMEVGMKGRISPLPADS